jgi:hypothetical protein
MTGYGRASISGMATTLLATGLSPLSNRKTLTVGDVCVEKGWVV